MKIINRSSDGKYRAFSFKEKVIQLWNKFIRLVKIATVCAIVLGFVSGIAYTAFKVGSAKMSYASNTVEIDNLGPKIESLKQEVLTKLSACEAPNFKEKDAPIILDTNAQMSLGLFMFQIKTVIYYEKTLYGKTVTRKEAVEIALDESKARNLAYDIIFKANSPKEWYNCTQRTDIKELLGVINKLK